MFGPSVQRALLLVAGAAALLLFGVPLGPSGLALGASIAYAALALPLPGRRAVGWLMAGLTMALLVKVALLAASPPTGLVASYWANATFEGLPERSTDFRGYTYNLGYTYNGPGAVGAATRIDRALDLRGDQFPVGFFNDAARFNFGPEAQPGRDQLPFSVRWQGWLEVPSDGERRFVLESVGAARVWLDDTDLVRVPNADAPQQAEARASLTAGWHALRVEYARPEARVPRLRLSWQPRPGEALEVVGGPAARWQRESLSGLEVLTGWGLNQAALSEWRLGEAGLGGWRLGQAGDLDNAADVALALVLVVWLGLAFRRFGRQHVWRAGLGVVPLVFLGHGMLLHGPLIGRTTILSGLDDWLVYESSARDILLNGPLMTGGQEHAAPYYGQPLYPYVLALAHWLGGEGLFGPLALQFAALGGVVVLSAMLARRAFGSRTAALCALACLLLFAQLQGEYWRVARQLFNENLYMPLVMASLIVLVDLARRRTPPPWWHLLLAGGLLGVTAISRSQFLACVPLALLILGRAWLRRPPQAPENAFRKAFSTALLALVTVVAGLVLAVAPVTARNWLVSGQLVPISASGGASLLEFHRPPPGLIDQAALQRDPLFEALHLDASTRTVLAFARQDPLGYLGTWLPLAAHSLGLPGRTGSGVYWPLLATVLVYLAAFALRRTRRLHVWPIHAFIASHLLVLMLFEADTYGYRLVMPMYAPLLVVAAQVPLAVLRLLAWPRSRMAAATGRAGMALNTTAVEVGPYAGAAAPLAQAAAGARAALTLAASSAHADARAEDISAPAPPPATDVIARAGDVLAAAPPAVAHGTAGAEEISAAAPPAAMTVGLRAGSAPSPRRRVAVAKLRTALVGLGVLALALQAASVVSAWADRETSLLGLGGAAAHAAATAERMAADVIYVASVDGTPRRFGAGSLPGLRYPWLKWFDPTRSLPLPATGTTAVYALSEIASHSVPGELSACLGPPDASAERVLRADEARQQCVASLPPEASLGATFDGLARVDAVLVPSSVAAGDSAETRLVWQPLVAHPPPHQIWLHLEDAEDATLWGNGTLDLYPARQWQPGEALLSRLPLPTDPTAMPDRYRLTLGMNPARPDAAPAPATWHGQRTDRVPVGELELLPATRAVTLNELPADMQPTHGVAGGGLELLATRPPAPDAWPGKRVRIGLLWRVLQDAPSAARVRLRLVRDTGEVAQDSVLPILGGRVSPSTLRGGSVVRDEQTLEVGPAVLGGRLTVELGMVGADALAQIGTLNVAGREHVLDTTSAAPEAVFGTRMALLAHRFEPARARPGSSVTVHLRWRGEAPMERSYKVFVHVLDASAERVVAQRDAEPLDGRAPTPGWLTGEVLDDEYRVALPNDLAAGDYRVEVGVYEERSGERLPLPSGENRLVLDTRLQVR